MIPKAKTAPGALYLLCHVKPNAAWLGTGYWDRTSELNSDRSNMRCRTSWGASHYFDVYLNSKVPSMNYELLTQNQTHTLKWLVRCSSFWSSLFLSSSVSYIVFCSNYCPIRIYTNSIMFLLILHRCMMLTVVPRRWADNWQYIIHPEYPVPSGYLSHGPFMLS